MTPLGSGVTAGCEITGKADLHMEDSSGGGSIADGVAQQIEIRRVCHLQRCQIGNAEPADLIVLFRRRARDIALPCVNDPDVHFEIGTGESYVGRATVKLGHDTQILSDFSDQNVSSSLALLDMTPRQILYTGEPIPVMPTVTQQNLPAATQGRRHNTMRSLNHRIEDS